MYSNLLNRIITCSSVIAVLFFSYIPFLYIFSIINTEKYLIFAMLISSILILTLLRTPRQMLCGHLKLNKNDVTILSTYMFFGMYALLSFTVTGNLLGDSFTLRTLVLVNPIFAILAMSCRQNKSDVIIIMTILSGVYFIYLIFSILQGTISFQPDTFQNIFMDLEGSFYQNINVYFGLFAICSISLLFQKQFYIKVIPIILIPSSIIGMFLIGGRASVVALVVVFLIYFLKESTVLSFKKSGIFKKVIFLLFSILMITLYMPETAEFLDASITWRRMLVITEGGDDSARIYLFTKAIELFFSDAKTLMFGGGINSFPIYISEYSTGMYPHNVFLELLAEYGIVGSILFAIPMIYILSVRKRQLGSFYGNTKEEKIVFLFFIYYLMINMVTGGLRSSWVLIFHGFLLLPSIPYTRDGNGVHFGSIDRMR